MDRFFQGVIFDLDGVLTDTAEYHYQAWKRLADRLGIHFDREINEKLKGVSRLESLQIILDHGGRQCTPEELERLAAEKNADYVSLIQGITPADLLPGVGNLLKSLKDAGYKLAVASVSKNAAIVIKNLQIENYFDYVADAAKIKKGKPDPEIFLTCATNLGLSPKVCIGVEDAQAGIQAIKAAGMFCVGVGDSKMLKAADVIISGLDHFNLEHYQEIGRQREGNSNA